MGVDPRLTQVHNAQSIISSVDLSVDHFSRSLGVVEAIRFPFGMAGLMFRRQLQQITELVRSWMSRDGVLDIGANSQNRSGIHEPGFRSLAIDRLLPLLATGIDVAIIVTDSHARVQWANPAFTTLTGFTLEEILGQRAGKAQQGPETDRECIEVMRRSVMRGEAFRVEVVNYKKSGEPYWVEIEARPLHGPRGEVEHFIATQKDITDVHNKTEQLRQSKLAAERLASDLASSRQQLHMAADAGGLSLWDWDLAHDRFWISSRWIPVATEQWIDKCGLWDIFNLAHEDDIPRIERSVQRLFGSESSQINEQFRMLIAGRWRWVNFRGAVSDRTDDGFPVRVSGTLLDETDRKEAEERAQADRDLLESVIGHIPHAVFWKNSERRYIGCNRKFAESLGLSSPQQVIGHTDLELRPDAKLAEVIANSDHEIVTTNRESLAQIQTYETPQGERRDIVSSKVPLCTSSGTVIGMLGIFNDVTELKRMERQLLDARQLESLGRLAAGVAHEINTPMQYISDNIEFLSESTEKVFNLIDTVQDQIAALNNEGKPTVVPTLNETDKKLRFMREQIPKAINDCLVGSRRVVEIVTAMKVFTHPGNKDFVSCNVNELIQSTTSITRNRWKYCATVSLQLASDLPNISCLPSEINQVILNLLVNAADAVSEKFGSSGAVQGLISVSTFKAPGGIVIEIRDNGCGIPEENYRRIFDPFFTTKEVGKGTGQGLTLCYGVVCNKHGGNLTVSSKLGEGTTFHVFLPEIPCTGSETNETLVTSADSVD